MKKQLLSIFLLPTIMLLSFNLQAEDVKPLPKWELVDSWGDSTHYDQSKQTRPTLLFFWASWCPYCHRVMPGFQRIYDAYAAKASILSINVWETGDAHAYMFDHEYEFPVLVEGEPVAEIYGIKGTPGLLVIAPDGDIRYRRKSGDKPDVVERKIKQALDQLLAEKT